jgi:hypothetical protein
MDKTNSKIDWSLLPLKVLEGPICVLQSEADQKGRFGWQEIPLADLKEKAYASLMRHLADYNQDPTRCDQDMVFILWADREERERRLSRMQYGGDEDLDEDDDEWTSS